MKEDIIDRINMLLCKKDIASAGFKKIRDLPESLDFFKTSDWQMLEYLLSVQDKKIDLQSGDKVSSSVGILCFTYVCANRRPGTQKLIDKCTFTLRNP